MTGSEIQSADVFTILSLDGGGAKGFYTLGVLKEIEAMLGRPLHHSFDLVFGTSTGAIIASLIALGLNVDKIHELYKEHVPRVMKQFLPCSRTAALANLATQVYGDKTFSDVLTNIGVVATKWDIERPIIFKGNIEQAHGRKGTFVPGFGVTIADAVQASCSAYPFFKCKTVTTSSGDSIQLVDGGFCANNPTLYAIADATQAMGKTREQLRVISIGVGVYPMPKYRLCRRVINWFPSVRLLQKTLEINTQSMEQLRTILFKDVRTVRISDTFEKPEMATDLTEHNLTKLNMLRQRGGESFASREQEIRALLAEKLSLG
jgi:patatin-like phospholipase/acyl hydrolase